LIAIAAEFGLVMALSLGAQRFSSGTATALFFGYAALNGFTLSLSFLAFDIGTIVSAFVATAVLFGAMTLVALTTRIDLTSMGTYLMMGLIGLVVAMLVNLFINSGPLGLLISIVGVIVFTGLTAYDTQQIYRMSEQVDAYGEAAAKVGIYGALKLYLDFINLFIFLLRLFASTSRRR
jgi:FtsH-binding integral membrane protein